MSSATTVNASQVFDFAEALYSEGMQRGYFQDSKTETKGSLKNPITEKDDVGQNNKEIKIDLGWLWWVMI